MKQMADEKNLQEDLSAEDTKETVKEAETENSVERENAAAEDADSALDESESPDAAAQGEGDNAAQADKADKKMFKKKQKADKKQDALKEKIDELEDKVKRQMAEFDNFRKRTEKEKTAMFETGAKSVIEKILPVVDNFERGLATVSGEEKGSPFVEGMEMTYRQLMEELEKMEVKPIPAVGEEFDPNFHNAVMQMESDEYESGVIAKELMKGYTYRDSVVRHSMVAVVS